MNTIQIGDTVLVTTPDEHGDRKIGRVVDVHSNFANNIQVAFKAPSYKTYYTTNELKVITREDHPEYFI
jgi:hypothetical protein